MATLNEFGRVLRNSYLPELRYQSATVALSQASAIQIDAVRDLMTEQMAWAEEELHEQFKDCLYGERLGPGQRELWPILKPQWQRARLRTEVLAMMPGKRPGKFVRP